MHLLLPLGSSSPLRSIQTAIFLPETLTVLQSGPSVIFVVVTGATLDSQLISPLLKPFHVPLMRGVVRSHASGDSPVFHSRCLLTMAAVLACTCGLLKVLQRVWA